MNPIIPLLSFIGYSKSGKTTSIESIIKYLKQIGHTPIITLKHTSHENFTIDTPGKNTWRYTKAGSTIVSSHSNNESAVLFNLSFSHSDILQFVKYILEYPKIKTLGAKPVIILEGFRELDIFHILCASNVEEIREQLEKHNKVLAISGVISGNTKESTFKHHKKSLAIIDSTKNPESIIELA